MNYCKYGGIFCRHFKMGKINKWKNNYWFIVNITACSHYFFCLGKFKAAKAENLPRQVGKKKDGGGNYLVDNYLYMYLLSMVHQIFFLSYFIDHIFCIEFLPVINFLIQDCSRIFSRSLSHSDLLQRYPQFPLSYSLVCE